MSTALAIASVTYVLKDLLNSGLIRQDITGIIGGAVTVTALPPDRIETGDTKEDNQLNLFMYQATLNMGWRNHALPSFNPRGERIQNPPLALDLHYLLTAYGAAELHNEILLGYGMQLLHENPVLTREAIRKSLTPPANPTDPGLPANLIALATSELADQIEQIKITPEVMNTEEMSRLWTAFGAKYRPNAGYKVTVVIIESNKSTITALPVQEPLIYVTPIKRPVIEKISSKAAPDAPIIDNQKILSGYHLVISGTALKGETVMVTINGDDVTSAITELTDTRIILSLQADIAPGIHGVQVIHQIRMGSPPSFHRGVESNVQPFMLSPEIIEPISVENLQVSGSAPRSADIKLKVKPGIRETQRITLLLNELHVPANEVPLVYSFRAPAIIPHSTPVILEDISIPVAGVKDRTYLVRIQVDDVESIVRVDAAGKYDAPQVVIP